MAGQQNKANKRVSGITLSIFDMCVICRTVLLDLHLTLEFFFQHEPANWCIETAKI